MFHYIKKNPARGNKKSLVDTQHKCPRWTFWSILWVNVCVCVRIQKIQNNNSFFIILLKWSFQSMNLPFKSNIECPTLSLFPKSHYEIRVSTLFVSVPFFFCYAQCFVFYVHVINSTTFQFIPFPFLKNAIIPLRRHINVQNKKTARDPYSSKTSNPSIK